MADILPLIVDFGATGHGKGSWAELKVPMKLHASHSFMFLVVVVIWTVSPAKSKRIVRNILTFDTSSHGTLRVKMNWNNIVIFIILYPYDNDKPIPFQIEHKIQS